MNQTNHTATRSRSTLFIGGGLVLFGSAVFGLRWWTVERFRVSTDDAYVRADIVTVAPRVSGYIVEVGVRDNQTVRAGELLARIDERDYSAKAALAQGAVAAARAEIAAQEARIANLRAQTEQQHDLIAQNAARMAGDEAELRRATLEFQRQRLLAQQEVTSAQRLEVAEADARKAGALAQSSKAALAAQKDHLSVLATEHEAASAALERARGMLEQAEATAQLARLDLEFTAIRAPVDGVVGQRGARVGQYAEVGVPLMAVVPQDAYIIANYKETQLERIRRGQRVEVQVDAFGAALRGRVDSFAPASGAQFALLPPDNATGNFTKVVQRIPVRIRLEDGQPRAAQLRPGMSVVTAVETKNVGP